jgi:nicotinamidase-related amidase
MRSLFDILFTIIGMSYLCCIIYQKFSSNDPQTETNTMLIDKLCQADKLIICGQALSHCVRYTLEDILKHWKKDKKLIYLLKNCSSSVNTEESLISANNFLEEMESEITVCNDSQVFDIYMEG